MIRSIGSAIFGAHRVCMYGNSMGIQHYSSYKKQTNINYNGFKDGNTNKLSIKQNKINTVEKFLTHKPHYNMSIIQDEPPEQMKAPLSPAKLSLRKPQPQAKRLSPLQILFKDLNQVKQKNRNIDKTDIEKVYHLIQRAKTSLSQEELIAAVKFFMSMLYKVDYPIQEIMQNPYIKKLEKYQKFIELENILYVINKELSKSKKASERPKQSLQPGSTLNQGEKKVQIKQKSQPQSEQAPNLTLINNLYLYCLQTLLPSLQAPKTSKTPEDSNSEAKIQKFKCQAILYKSFGKYVIQFGDKDSFTNGVVAIRKSVYAHQELIGEEFKKMQMFIKKCANDISNQTKGVKKKKTKLQRQKQQLQINALKQNIRRLIQSMLETMNYYYLLKKPSLKSPTGSPSSTNSQVRPQSQSQAQQTLIQLLSMISTTMKFKSMVPGIQAHSRYYHRLMQIFYQLEYTYALMRKNVERVKEVRGLMKQFIKQSINDIQECERLDVSKEIAMSVFTIQYHLSKGAKGAGKQAQGTVQQIKSDLSDLALKIIKAGKMQQKPMSKQVITRLLSDFLKKITH